MAQSHGSAREASRTKASAPARSSAEVRRTPFEWVTIPVGNLEAGKKIVLRGQGRVQVGFLAGVRVTGRSFGPLKVKIIREIVPARDDPELGDVTVRLGERPRPPGSLETVVVDLPNQICLRPRPDRVDGFDLSDVRIGEDDVDHALIIDRFEVFTGAVGRCVVPDGHPKVLVGIGEKPLERQLGVLEAVPRHKCQIDHRLILPCSLSPSSVPIGNGNGTPSHRGVDISAQRIA